MSAEFDKALAGLQGAMSEGVNIAIDEIRRRALYPDLAAMEKRTRQISRAQATLPLSQADSEKVHLIHHIDMLKRELGKLKQI